MEAEQLCCWWEHSLLLPSPPAPRQLWVPWGFLRKADTWKRSALNNVYSHYWLAQLRGNAACALWKLLSPFLIYERSDSHTLPRTMMAHWVLVSSHNVAGLTALRGYLITTLRNKTYYSYFTEKELRLRTLSNFPEDAELVHNGISHIPEHSVYPAQDSMS